MELHRVPHAGPADPMPAATVALRPLGTVDVSLDPDGLLGGWQERNAAATLPYCVDQMDVSGANDNIRRVVGQSDADFSGMWFQDSDVYKTLEAAAWEAARRPDSPFGEYVSEWAAMLAKAQDPDGYLNSYFQVDHRDKQWQDLGWSHELYCAGHLIQAGVAAHRAGLGDQLLAVARRFADLLVTRFGPDGIDAVCGHPQVETALVELYRTTGHVPYLDLAQRFIALRGKGLLGEHRFGPRYLQDHAPVLEAPEVTGHAVRQLYLLAGVIDVAVETGDAALLAAAERLWESAYHTQTYVTGAHGARHRDEAYGDPYELPPDRAYAETCAAIASFQFNWRMLLATGQRRYADEMERVLYNAVAGSTAADGKHFFYSNPLHLRTGHDGSDEDAPSRRLSWYSCACCPPNIARLMASLHTYLATADDDGLQLHLYQAGTVRSSHGTVRVATEYPWDGRVALTVTATSSRPWTLSLRVPGWATDATVDGVAPDVHDGYVRLTREWAPGDTVVLDLPMPVRRISAHPRVDAVRGCVALARGPLVYCVEQVDLPPGTVLEDVSLLAGVPVEVVDGGAAPVTLSARGLVGDGSAAPLYVDRPATAGPSTAVTFTAVPYFLWGNRAPGPMRVWLPHATQPAAG